MNNCKKIIVNTVGILAVVSFLLSNTVLAEVVPGISYEKDHGECLTPDAFERAHKNQEVLIEKMTEIEMLRGKKLDIKTSKDRDNMDASKGSDDEDIGFATIQTVTEIVVKEGEIVSITTSGSVPSEDKDREENDNQTAATDTPTDDLDRETEQDNDKNDTKDTGGSLVDSGEDKDKCVSPDNEADYNNEGDQGDLPDLSAEDNAPEETLPQESSGFFNETTRSSSKIEWESITAVTDSQLIVTSDSTDHREVYDGINRSHSKLTTSQKHAYEAYFESIKPYYDEIEPMLMSNIELWWQKETNPCFYFAGSDGVLDEIERRKMLAVAVYVLGKDFGNGRADNPQTAGRSNNTQIALQYSRPQDILSYEKMVRKEILLPGKEIYDKMLSQIENNFIMEVDGIVAALNESLIIRLHNNITTILVLPVNEKID